MTMRPLRRVGLLLGALVLAACDQNAIQIDDITAPLSGARVKFFNFGMGTPAVNFYANNTKMTAVLSATGVESTAGVAFGGVASGNLYTGIAPGSYTFSGRIAATIDKDVPIASIPGTLVDGRAYSVYLAGVYDATAKRVDGFVVEDQFPDTFDFTQALVRFVNASPNAQPQQLTIVDATPLVSTPIGAAVPFKSAGAFVAVPTGSYNLSTVQAGVATPVFARTAVSFLAGRVYTITARGDATISTTGTAVNRAFLDNSVNR
jgi:hypothetical protein